MKRLLYTIIFLISTCALAQNKNCNCCTENHQAFDFWIGEWTVTNPDGSLAGENSIKKLQNNCILLENWTSAKGNFTGTSQNFYNAKSKQWEQLWIDNQGGFLKLKGSRIGNQMILQSENDFNAEGTSFYHRVTWTANEDGTVRQLWETFTEGQEVSVAFDGLYKKREN